MKLSSFNFIIIALLGMITGCTIIGDDPMYKLSDLQGLWHETHVKDMDHYVRFTTEQSEENGFLLGLEWDEEEDIYESDLLEAREALGHPGNGWFKYQLDVMDGGLTEIHLMDNEGAEIPKVYVVTKLTDTELEYYEKEFTYIKFYFSRVVETKE